MILAAQGDKPTAVWVLILVAATPAAVALIGSIVTIVQASTREARQTEEADQREQRVRQETNAAAKRAVEHERHRQQTETLLKLQLLLAEFSDQTRVFAHNLSLHNMDPRKVNQELRFAWMETHRGSTVMARRIIDDTVRETALGVLSRLHGAIMGDGTSSGIAGFETGVALAMDAADQAQDGLGEVVRTHLMGPPEADGL
jgi:hypothetical protein